MQDRRTIEEEQDEYEDLVLLNMKDSYEKLSEKVKSIAVLRFGF